MVVLDIQVSKFLIIYRLFHNALFAICIVIVIVLYSFIYKAVYQRRRTRTKKFSAYRRILHSYLISDQTNGKSIARKSFIRSMCCYCCHKIPRSSSHQLDVLRSLNHQDKTKQSSVVRQKPAQIVLEVNGARGKRYSAVSMTSMTYLTSGVWDETSPTNLIRSRINSTAAVNYCGTEPSSASRPSTTTEDSFILGTQLKPTGNARHLTVPNHATVLSNDLNETELLGNMAHTTNLLHPSIVRKSSRQQRPSDAFMHPRKVSFSKMIFCG